MTPLVGLVYKFTAERAGGQSLDDLMKVRSIVHPATARKFRRVNGENVKRNGPAEYSNDLRVEPLNHYKRCRHHAACVKAMYALAFDDQYAPLFGIPRSHYVLAVWPGSHLYFLHQNATAGYRFNGAHCLFSRLSCV